MWESPQHGHYLEVTELGLWWRQLKWVIPLSDKMKSLSGEIRELWKQRRLKEQGASEGGGLSRWEGIRAVLLPGGICRVLAPVWGASGLSKSEGGETSRAENSIVGQQKRLESIRALKVEQLSMSTSSPYVTFARSTATTVRKDELGPTAETSTVTQCWNPRSC